MNNEYNYLKSVHTCIQIHHCLSSAVKSSNPDLLCYVSKWEHAFGDVKLITRTKTTTIDS